ncbi:MULTISPECIES: glycosyltransferase family A protein [unclassified Leucobacter]|uniref:glycosyltransferase family A protein n=1 Tax=unclassified Leucobacter TaxID=2621730 RepID=UPI00165D8F87|nr:MULTISPECIES: glycosyltransferase family 2 protein [unclassified Leucobacter]MBC9936593.1 glycosyltransferase family 2 protein [Leucobacter sp. cx-87]
MSLDSSQPTLTVAILTYNGEDYLRQILESLRRQSYSHSIDVLIIDSGSTDATLDIVAEFDEARLVRIPNGEFGHGRTRNLAARLATGEVIAYLTHDAVPMHTHWASEMVAPFAYSARIVAVMGKQVPRSNCFPLLKYEINAVFSGLGSDLGTTLYELHESDRADEGLQAAKAFYSDVNSAARREFLLNTIPYRDVRYAEDQLFGLDLLKAGYLKAYAPGAAVEHSNDLTLAEYGPRIFDETVALREIGREVSPVSAKTRLRLTVRGILADSLRILRDRSFGLRRKLYWLVMNPAFHVRKWKYHNLGAALDLSNAGGDSSHSLEAQRKTDSIRGKQAGANNVSDNSND